MQLSLSTVFMTVLTTAILMILLSLCLNNQKLMVKVGYKLLALFAFFTVLRFALPFELPFTTTISLPHIFSHVTSIFYLKLLLPNGERIKLWWILTYIWLIGAAGGSLWYLFCCIRAKYYTVLYGKELTHAAPYEMLVSKICEDQNQRNRFRVIEIPGLNAPMLFGIFSPKILIPEHTDLPEDQLRYILRHEMTHHFHHDLLLKSLIKFLTIIYWWNPICGRLNKQVEIILEMHVDDALTISNPEYTSEYLHCLLDYFSERTNQTPILSYLTMGLFLEKESDIRKRFRLLTHNQFKLDLVLSCIICGIMLLIYVSSYTFVLESYNPPQNDDMYYNNDALGNVYIPSLNTAYLIDNGDGTYNLFSSSGVLLETIDSIEYYSGTPIYTPENNPYQE